MSGATATVAAVAAVAGTAITAYSSVQSGRAASRAAAEQQQQMDVREQQQRLAATQQETARRSNLNDTLGNIAAVYGGRGVSLDSPTVAALTTGIVNEQEQDLRTERLNTLLDADTSRLAAASARRQRSASLLSGYLGAAGAVANGAYKYSLYSAPTAAGPTRSSTWNPPH